MSSQESPDARARELLRHILTDKQWAQFAETGAFEVSGFRGTYCLSCREQTQFRDSQTGRLLNTACLQLSVSTPAPDRLIAEYVLIRNDEDLYWRTANVFPAPSDNRSIVVVAAVLVALLLLALWIAQ